MGQISLQLISSSAFDDCSVTVIYSGVTITDVLLLALTVPCRCDRVFWDYSGLLKCGALHFFCCFKFCSMQFLAQWPGTWETGHGVS